MSNGGQLAIVLIVSIRRRDKVKASDMEFLSARKNSWVLFGFEITHTDNTSGLI